MEKPEVIYRHSGFVHVTHWVNALVLLVLLMSGLQIFNAHPALYLGSKSVFEDPVMSMRAVRSPEGPKAAKMKYPNDACSSLTRRRLLPYLAAHESL